MHIISFVTQKGGSGKTTLAVNCAVVAAQKSLKKEARQRPSLAERAGFEPAEGV